MKYTMIIPAKGNSSRLPHKNKRLFLGHPLVAWSIVQGVMSKYVDEVWVSTDDDEIRRIAEFYGAKVMMRNYVDEVATPGFIPIREWLNRMTADGKLTWDDWVITRLCTTPTMLPHDTDAAIEKFEWLHEHFGAMGIGVGAELRTFHSQRKVVDSIWRGIGTDHISENNYAVVQNLAFFGINAAKSLVEPAAPPADWHVSSYAGDHPHGFYYNVQPWQMQDVDTQEEWEFAEIVADHYILQGRDMLEVYKETK